MKGFEDVFDNDFAGFCATLDGYSEVLAFLYNASPLNLLCSLLFEYPEFPFAPEPLAEYR